MSGSNDLLGDLVAEAQRGARGETGALVLLERETEMRNLSKKAKTIIAGAAIAGLASTGVAYAYWTTTGSGTGTGSAGTNAAITITGTAATAVTPGGTTSTVSFIANNPATGPQQVTSVSLTGVDAFAGPGFTNPIAIGTLSTQCDVSQFSMTTVTENQNIPAGGPTALANTGVLVMANDVLHNQDGCKNAVLRLNLTSN